MVGVLYFYIIQIIEWKGTGRDRNFKDAAGRGRKPEERRGGFRSVAALGISIFLLSANIDTRTQTPTFGPGTKKDASRLSLVMSIFF